LLLEKWVDHPAGNGASLDGSAALVTAEATGGVRAGHGDDNTAGDGAGARACAAAESATSAAAASGLGPGGGGCGFWPRSGLPTSTLAPALSARASGCRASGVRRARRRASTA